MTEQERIDIAYLDTGVYENPWRENLFETLPEDRKTAEVCRFAIKKSAFNIEFVPEAMKTPELCLAAAGHRGETLKFVPDRSFPVIKSCSKKALPLLEYANFRSRISA